jgi:hypothetical protein
LIYTRRRILFIGQSKNSTLEYYTKLFTILGLAMLENIMFVTSRYQKSAACGVCSL